MIIRLGRCQVGFKYFHFWLSGLWFHKVSYGWKLLSQVVNGRKYSPELAYAHLRQKALKQAFLHVLDIIEEGKTIHVIPSLWSSLRGLQKPFKLWPHN